MQSFSNRILSYLENWPWLVFEDNGKIAGYAYAGRHRERVAYQWCVESSVYIHDDFVGKGVGRALYSALLKILEFQGFRNVYAVINLPNDPSVAFHESFGFRWFASYKDVGYKLGKWKTVGWWLKQINEYNEEPSPPLVFKNISSRVVESLMGQDSK